MKLRDRLVDDWKQAWRWSSVRWNAFGAILLPLLTVMPTLSPEIKALLPIEYQALAAGLYCLLGIAFRVTNLKKPNG